MRVVRAFARQAYVRVKEMRASQWAEQDYAEIKDIYEELTLNKTWKKIMYTWQHGLELKKAYRERRAEREARIPEMGTQPAKIIAHPSLLHMNLYQSWHGRPGEKTWEDVFAAYQKIVHGELQLTLPVETAQIFAVVQFNNSQYKVSPDDVIITEKLPYEVGSQLLCPHVLLIGTTHYTAVGRPYVEEAQVVFDVEEQTLSEKVLVFKKKRRKRYKKLKGHRQQVTVLRCAAVTYTPPTDAVSLQSPTVTPFQHTFDQLKE